MAGVAAFAVVGAVAGVAVVAAAAMLAALTVVGLATDYCVKQTALEALQEGFAVTVDTTAVRGVDVEAGDADRALSELRTAGAVLA